MARPKSKISRDARGKLAGAVELAGREEELAPLPREGDRRDAQTLAWMLERTPAQGIAEPGRLAGVEPPRGREAAPHSMDDAGCTERLTVT
jgi:hypothetical protein